MRWYFSYISKRNIINKLSKPLQVAYPCFNRLDVVSGSCSVTSWFGFNHVRPSIQMYCSERPTWSPPTLVVMYGWLVLGGGRRNQQMVS